MAQLAVHCHISCASGLYLPYFGYDPDLGELNNADIVYNHIFAPEDIYDLVHVDLVIDEEDVFWSAGLSDIDSLLWFEKNFGSAEKAEYESGCPFWGALYMRRSDGMSGVIYVSMDSCKTFRSGDTHYTWGIGGNEAFFALFGATDYESLLSMDFPTAPQQEFPSPQPQPPEFPDSYYRAYAVRPEETEELGRNLQYFMYLADIEDTSYVIYDVVEVIEPVPNSPPELGVYVIFAMQNSNHLSVSQMEAFSRALKTLFPDIKDHNIHLSYTDN